jgi:hypothetical protein
MISYYENNGTGCSPTGYGRQYVEGHCHPMRIAILKQLKGQKMTVTEYIVSGRAIINNISSFGDPER